MDHQLEGHVSINSSLMAAVKANGRITIVAEDGEDVCWFDQYMISKVLKDAKSCYQSGEDAAAVAVINWVESCFTSVASLAKAKKAVKSAQESKQ